ncbi:MAG: phosphatase PAP2 family protein [Clostridiales bacterium]|nr:phosphatase PAP2 family protein [Clostridiales bacterium]
MSRDHYARMTDVLRKSLSHMPLGEGLLFVPTLLIALIYILSLLFLFMTQDPRLFRFILVPAVCFLAATVLRRLIGKERPYDRYGLPPVGKYIPGKKRSLPSRHAASAAAIAIAVVYVFPMPAVVCFMGVLCLLVCALRVFSGYHDISDVLAALFLSGLLSFAGYSGILI